MVKKRERIDIIYDMLIAIQKKPKGIKQTHIMYKANLSYAQLKKYLSELLSKELIIQEKQKDTTITKLTDKGYKFIEKIEDIKSFDSAFGL